MRKRLSTLNIGLGLFAMLMIHVGPLVSALQMAETPAELHGVHHPGSASAGHGQHGRPAANEPAWLAALELCGYCELLTLNPPLTVSLDFVLPGHRPEQAQPLPEPPLRSALRHSGGCPRAPPMHFHS